MWKLCEGRTRCEICGAFVTRSWKYFTKPALWTRCVCEPCAKEA